MTFTLDSEVADTLAALERRAFIGRLDAQGLPGHRNPVFSRRRREGTLPILDCGFVARPREGAFRVVREWRGSPEGGSSSRAMGPSRRTP
jgi:hypothetical protein